MKMISVREPNLLAVLSAIGGTILLLGDREGAQFILKFLSRVLIPFLQRWQKMEVKAAGQ
jgi:hypothetical protein